MEVVARCRREVAEVAAARLVAARTEADLGQLLADVAASVERTLLAHRPPGAPAPACGRGCATCCVLNVATLPVEGAAIAAHLRAGVTDAQAQARAAELAAFGDRVRWLGDRERAAHRLTCRFLDPAGGCSVYPVRPLACRSASSLDAAACREALGGDEDEAVVVMDTLQKVLYDEARHAVAEVLAARGLDARRRDVSAMSAAFLADPAAAGHFLGGGMLPLDPA